jgi:hypothetical protein
MSTTRTGFDWPIYADATFAGLSVLIPVPLVDAAFEWFFRRRMAAAIARRRGQRLPPEILLELNRGPGCSEGCLVLPFKLILLLLKRLSRKILYFLTVKEATDQLSHYWHRAFLIDCMLEQGHLDSLEGAAVARLALDETLDHPDTSPLHQFAQQLAHNTRHIWRSLRLARRGREDEMIEEKKTMMARTWDNFAAYLQEVGERYSAHYLRIQAEQEEARRRAAEEAARLDAGRPEQ